MNRQIKFRAKTTANGHWVYGNLIDYGDNTFAIRNSKSQPWVQADSSGKEIYEGDVITVNGRYPRVVLWDMVSWALMPCEHYHNEHFWGMNLQHPENDWWKKFADEMEVVGNIHEQSKS